MAHSREDLGTQARGRSLTSICPALLLTVAKKPKKKKKTLDDLENAEGAGLGDDNDDDEEEAGAGSDEPADDYEEDDEDDDCALSLATNLRTELIPPVGSNEQTEISTLTTERTMKAGMTAATEERVRRFALSLSLQHELTHPFSQTEEPLIDAIVTLRVVASS